MVWFLFVITLNWDTEKMSKFEIFNNKNHHSKWGQGPVAGKKDKWLSGFCSNPGWINPWLSNQLQMFQAEARVTVKIFWCAILTVVKRASALLVLMTTYL